MSKTNNLNSHHAESMNFRADKMIPKETMKWYGSAKAGLRKAFKKLYKKKSRQFIKNENRNLLENE